MAKAQTLMLEPIYQVIPYNLAQDFANNSLDQYKDIIFLHSSSQNFEIGRYSFIGIAPFMKFESINTDDSDEIINKIEEILANYSLINIQGLPPFQGGVAGYLSYDLVRNFEKLPMPLSNETQLPKLAIGVYDLVVSMDHFSKVAWIISFGLPEINAEYRLKRAQERMNWILHEMRRSYSFIPSNVYINKEEISSNFTDNEYHEAVKKAKEYIKNGDIFQVNLSQCFSCKMPQNLSDFEIFLRLQKLNPAPFSAFISIGNISIISSSPERFIKIKGKEIETRPIKGTIRRSCDLKEDCKLADQLLNSEKDRSENAMIVDLMRNDLAKICLPHSIKVEKFCTLESFETVHDLVSVIHGQLRPNIKFKELLHAVIAGGSVTGAPKIRAMEIIHELEGTLRGPYCGNAFYYGFNGVFDSSILIRTFVLFQNVLCFSAGGAVITDSTPEREYEETIVKADALLKTLTTFRD